MILGTEWLGRLRPMCREGSLDLWSSWHEAALITMVDLSYWQAVRVIGNHSLLVC
jgi:hypothetical protein